MISAARLTCARWRWAKYPPPLRPHPEQAVVLLREKALGDTDVQHRRRRQRGDGHGQGDALMVEYPIQAAQISVVQTIENPIAGPGKAPFLLVGVGFEQPSAV